MTSHEMTTEAFTGKKLLSLLNSREVAAILQISLKAVCKLVREKEPPCMRVAACDHHFSHKQAQDCLLHSGCCVRACMGCASTPEIFRNDFVRGWCRHG